MRIRAHTAIPARGERGQLRYEAAIFIEELLRLVAAHPALQLQEVLGMVRIDNQRYLVRTESALDLEAVNSFGSCPPLGRSEHDHRPTWPRWIAHVSRLVLNSLDKGDSFI